MRISVFTWEEQNWGVGGWIFILFFNLVLDQLQVYSDMTYLRNLHANRLWLRGVESVGSVCLLFLKLQVLQWNFPHTSTQWPFIYFHTNLLLLLFLKNSAEFFLCHTHTSKGVTANLWFSVFDRKTAEISDLIVWLTPALFPTRVVMSQWVVSTVNSVFGSTLDDF